ncbi:MAG: VOC family protein [Aquihabitans sp.]
MSIFRMNHAVLYVRDAARTARFYQDVLDFTTVHSMNGGAFLRAPESDNDHDIAFFSIGDEAKPSSAGRGTVGLYHLAWEVATLTDLAATAGKLRDAGSLVGASDHGASKSLYAKDPDGLEFEVCWVVPVHLLADEDQSPVTLPLDLDAAVATYGADTPSRSLTTAT